MECALTDTAVAGRSRVTGSDFAERGSRPILRHARWPADVHETNDALVGCKAECVKYTTIVGVPFGDPACAIAQCMRGVNKVHSGGASREHLLPLRDFHVRAGAADNRDNKRSARQTPALELDLLRFCVEILCTERRRDGVAGGNACVTFEHDEAPRREFAVIRYPCRDGQKRVDLRGGRSRAGEFGCLERAPGGEELKSVGHCAVLCGDDLGEVPFLAAIDCKAMPKSKAVTALMERSALTAVITFGQEILLSPQRPLSGDRGMDAKQLPRPASAKLVIALTAIAMCFALGQAQAQLVNPVPPPPPPTFNPSSPSSPSTSPQPPETPVSPGPSTGLPGSGAPSGSNESTPSTASHLGTAAPVVATPSVASAKVSHHGYLRHRRHGKTYAARVIGPSYFPGLGLVYPPYPDPCHWRPIGGGPWVGSWTYTCS